MESQSLRMAQNLMSLKFALGELQEKVSQLQEQIQAVQEQLAMDLPNSFEGLREALNREFKRLGVSTEHDPYSGLMVKESDHSASIAVKIFDDYASGDYDGQRVLQFLRSLSPNDVTLSSDNNIWEALGKFSL